MKRAERRHHRERLLEKVKWYYGGDRKYAKEGHCQITKNDKETCSKMINSRQKCSGPSCCGNPRRIRGRNIRTRQELRAGYSGKLH